MITMRNVFTCIQVHFWFAATALVCVTAARAATTSPGESRFSVLRGSTAYRIALAPHAGNNKCDEQIRKSQEAVRQAVDPRPQLERLGWLYVAKARASHDPGFYSLAEQCALALDTGDGNNCAALLLRGHVAQSFHRFKDAEIIARQLIAQRELAFDHGLLGDSLADQGNLVEAIGEYQRMIDLRPDLQSYSRVAHVRWLKGDLSGAIEAAELAVNSASPADAESAAWACTRLASYSFQAGEKFNAESSCKAALDFVGDYPPALLLRGRMFLSDGKPVEAAEVIRRAAAANPLPEYQWALAEALREAGKIEEANNVEAEIKRSGVANDPRTCSLFLATRGEQASVALRLAERELECRHDIFTHDALAWALLAAGRCSDAWAAMQHALAEGTKDARLFLHAGAIAARLGRGDAEAWLSRARELERLLLPSEQGLLQESLRLSTRTRASGSGLRADAL